MRIIPRIEITNEKGNDDVDSYSGKPEFSFYTKKASAQLYGSFSLIAYLKEIIAIIPSFALGGEKEICK